MQSSRVAVVTGAGRGIGRAIAEQLVRDGMLVEIWDLNAESATAAASELAPLDSRTRGFAVDVADGSAVKQAAERLLGEHERIDVLVNNAGWDRFSWFLESREEDWTRTIGVCYRAVLATSRYFGRDLMKAEQGRIINIASDTAKLGGPLEAVYSGAKAAVVSFSRALARELADSGTTVNVICPGANDTPLYQDIEREFATNPRWKDMFEGGLRAASLKQIPLGRLGLPTDIANAVSFFASPEAEFITGQTLSVSGGQTMY